MQSRLEASELLDSAPADIPTLSRNLTEMAWLYRLTGGEQLGWRAIAPLLTGAASAISGIDIACGGGYSTRWLQQRARRAGYQLNLLGCDIQPTICRIAQQRAPTICGDALQLPWAADSVDIVVCAQAIHHFAPAQVLQLLHELQRVARRGGVIVDLQRSRLGYWGARLAALGPMTQLGKHDGPLSVLRAYTQQEMRALAAEAGMHTCAWRANALYWALAWHA